MVAGMPITKKCAFTKARKLDAMNRIGVTEREWRRVREEIRGSHQDLKWLGHRQDLSERELDGLLAPIPSKNAL